MARQVILADVKLTIWDMYRFIQLAIWWRFGWFITIMAGVAVWFGYSLFTRNVHWASWLSISGALLLFFLLPYVFFILPYLAIRKRVRRNPHLAGPFTYVFSEAGMDVSTPRSQVRVNWDAIGRVRETSSWFLVYPRTYPTQTIPMRFLVDADQLAALRALVQTYVTGRK